MLILGGALPFQSDEGAEGEGEHHLLEHLGRRHVSYAGVSGLKSTCGRAHPRIFNNTQ